MKSCLGATIYYFVLSLQTVISLPNLFISPLLSCFFSFLKEMICEMKLGQCFTITVLIILFNAQNIPDCACASHSKLEELNFKFQVPKEKSLSSSPPIILKNL